ncbi:hypothetical protein ACFW04_007385 [Cataglyphis niger]
MKNVDNIIIQSIKLGDKRIFFTNTCAFDNEIFTGTLLPNNCILINCAVNVGFLCSKLFTKYLPFTEVSKSSNDCAERKKIFSLLYVDINLLKCQDFKAIKNNIIIKGL